MYVGGIWDNHFFLLLAEVPTIDKPSMDCLKSASYLALCSLVSCAFFDFRPRSFYWVDISLTSRLPFFPPF